MQWAAPVGERAAVEGHGDRFAVAGVEGGLGEAGELPRRRGHGGGQPADVDLCDLAAGARSGVADLELHLRVTRVDVASADLQVAVAERGVGEPMPERI